MSKKIHLPKPASCATDEELKSYSEQFDPAGDRRVLAEEILRLRSLIDNPRDTGLVVQLQPFLRTEKPSVVRTREVDDALI
jgi:hypothetical protein